MSEENWLVADYFDSFRCKCGSCRHSCCGGWRIAVSEEEYFRIIGLDCSAELHARIEGAFARPDFPTKDRYMLMEPDWTGRCRILGEDGLCMLQKECGEAAISEVCRVYPRSYRSENGILSACCSGSCEGVVELLLRREPLHFVSESADLFSHGKGVHAEITENVPIDVSSIFTDVVAILQDRTRPIPERIGTIADRYGLGDCDHRLKASIEQKGLYSTLMPVITEFCEEAPSFTDYVAEFKERYGASDFGKLFGQDLKDFEEHFPDWSCYIENLLCNNMLYSSFPAVDRRVDPHKAVLGLSLQYTLLRVMCICHTAVCGWTKESLVDAIAEVYHVVEHTAFYFNALVLLK